MKEGDRQLGKPARLYRDTKANIEALALAAADEGCEAFATDTNRFGTYNGAAWVWVPEDVQGWMDATQSAGRITGGAVTAHAYPITGVTAGGAGAGEFEIAGDHTAAFGAGVILTVSGSTGNDGDYTVSAGGAAHAGGTTTIPVDEAVPNAVADGNIAAGTVDVASGTGYIKDADSDTAATVPFDWAATTTPLIPTNDTSNWVYLDYNGGTPIAGITDDHDIITRNDIFVLDRLWREDSVLYIVGKGQNAYNLSMRAHRNLTRIFHFQRGNGVKLTEKAVRKVGVSEGNLYRGLNEIPVAVIDTSGADTFTTLYRDGGGGWTQVTGQTTIDNANYDDGSGILQGIVNNQYGVYWAYLDYAGDLYIQYGQASYHLAEAEAAQFPVTRTFLDKFAMLVAKIVVKEGALENFYSIEYPWDTRFFAAPVANHNNLGGLQGGVASEYYHLTQAQHTSLTTVAAAGYALVSTGANVWAADQTPAWTGEHSFAAGIAFVGASGANEVTIPDNTAVALELLDAGGLEYVRIVSTDTNPYFLIDPACAGINVGIGIATPDQEHVYIGDDALVITEDFFGLRVRHIITDASGATEADDIYGLQSDIIMNDTGQTIGYLRGAYIRAYLIDGIIGDNYEDIIGCQVSAQMDAGTVNDDVIGMMYTVDVNAGTIADDIIGMWANVDVEAAVTSIGGDIYGALIAVDADKDPTGSVYMIYLDEGTNVDYGIYQNGSADNYLGGKLGLGTTTPAGIEHIYSTADASRGIIIDAKGTSSGQSAFLNFLTVGTGAVDVGNAAAQGWHFSARGNAYTTVAQQNDLLVYFWDGSSYNLVQYWDHLGNVGIGVAYPAAKCHIDQASTSAAIPVLTLDQADVSDGFINFIGSDRGGILSSDALASVRVELGGVVYRLALYVDA